MQNRFSMTKSPLGSRFPRSMGVHLLRSQKLRQTPVKTGTNLDTQIESVAQASPDASTCTSNESLVLEQHNVSYPKIHGHNDLRQIFGVRKSGDHIAVGYADGSLRIFSSDRWNKISVYPPDFDTPDPEEHKLIERGIQVPRSSSSDPRDPITSLNWLSDERLLFLSGNHISVADFSPDLSPSDRMVVSTVPHNHGALYVCDALRTEGSLNASKFIVGGTERRAIIFDANTMQETCCIRKSLYLADSFGHSNRISQVKFLPNADGQIYLTGSWDNSVAIWDCRSGKRERYIDEPLALVGSGPEAIDLDTNSILLASYRATDALQIFDFNSCRLIETLTSPANFIPYTCRFATSDTSKMLVGGKFVNSQKQGSLMVMRRHVDQPSRVVFEDHNRPSAVWSVDAYDDNIVLGHADGTLGIYY